jgi:hypothetical protein
MTLEEKLELLQRLQRGESVELPVIEGSSTGHNSSRAAYELEE